MTATVLPEFGAALTANKLIRQCSAVVYDGGVGTVEVRAGTGHIWLESLPFLSTARAPLVIFQALPGDCTNAFRMRIFQHNPPVHLQLYHTTISVPSVGIWGRSRAQDVSVDGKVITNDYFLVNGRPMLVN